LSSLDKIRAELLDALGIVERGGVIPNQMIGAWAREIGQTQFLPSAYRKFAVDCEGYGRRDLIHQRQFLTWIKAELLSCCWDNEPGLCYVIA
jgi:transglycosylase-like protein with SLT domain